MTRACKVSAQILGHWWANVSQSILNLLDQNKYKVWTQVYYSVVIFPWPLTFLFSFLIPNSAVLFSFFYCAAPLPHAHLCLSGFTVMGKIPKIFRAVNRKSIWPKTLTLLSCLHKINGKNVTFETLNISTKGPMSNCSHNVHMNVVFWEVSLSGVCVKSLRKKWRLNLIFIIQSSHKEDVLGWMNLI